MTRTKNQKKGDDGEKSSMAQDWWDGYEVEKAPKNQPGHDYRRRRRKCCIRVG